VNEIPPYISEPNSDVSSMGHFGSERKRFLEGKPVWTEDLLSNQRRILSYFDDRTLKGFIEQDLQNMQCDVYVLSLFGSNEEPIKLTNELISFHEAIILLQSQID
jgi:hypothetical protein